MIVAAICKKMIIYFDTSNEKMNNFFQNDFHEEPVGRITQIINARMGTTKYSMAPTASNGNVQNDATTNKRGDTSWKEEKW